MPVDDMDSMIRFDYRYTRRYKGGGAVLTMAAHRDLQLIIVCTELSIYSDEITQFEGWWRETFIDPTGTSNHTGSVIHYIEYAIQ